MRRVLPLLFVSSLGLGCQTGPSDLGVLAVSSSDPAAGLLYVVTGSAGRGVPPDSWIEAPPVWATRSPSQARALLLRACADAGAVDLGVAPAGCVKAVWHLANVSDGQQFLEVQFGTYDIRLTTLPGVY